MLTSFFRKIFFIFLLSSNIDLAYGGKINGAHISNLPSSNEHFTGRKEILEQIHDGFEKGDYIISLVGFLGTGKTQTARRFAEQSKADYDIIWFIDAKGSVVDQLRGLAEILNERNTTTHEKKININAQPANFLQQIHTTLKLIPKRWLLVLDNVQERGAILDFLPPKTTASRGNVLITTRNEVGWERPIRIGNFSRQESMALLQDIIPTNNDEHLDKLATLLFNHPLSLAQAGCYIRKYSHTNVSNYITLFTNRRKDLWEREEAMIKEDKDIKDLHDNYQMTGSTALQLSLEKLKKLSPLGIKLLYHSAFFHNNEIPEDMLSALSKTSGYDPIFDCNDAIHQLIKVSLFEKNRVVSQHEKDNSLFNMHDLTQVVLLDIQSLEEKKNAINTNLIVLTKMLSGEWDKVIKEFIRRPYLLAHIESLCAHAKNLKIYSPSLIELMTYLLEYHMYHTRDQIAYEKLVQEIDSLLKEAKDIPPLILARFYSDRVYARSPSIKERGQFHNRVIQDYENAIQIFQDASDQIEELFRVYMNFAQYYFLKGFFEKSKYYIKKSDEILNRVKSESSKNLFYFVKAWMLCEMEEYALAHQSINEAVQGLAKEENPALKIYIKNMKAWVDLKAEDYESAYIWAVKAQEEALDFFDHKNTDSIIWSAVVIGVYKLKKGDLKGAEATIKDSLVRLEREYEGPMEVMDQAYSHAVLGDIYTCKGKLIEAKAEYQIAEKIYNKLYSRKEGEGLSELYVSFAILGAKLKDDFLAKHYLDVHQKYYGPDHKGTKKILQYFRENNVEML